MMATKSISPMEELRLIQRELSAELLVSQSKNQALLLENASIKEQLQKLTNEKTIQEHTNQQMSTIKKKMEQLVVENARLSAELDHHIRENYFKEANQLDGLHYELDEVRKYQYTLDHLLNDCCKQQQKISYVMVQEENGEELKKILELVETYAAMVKKRKGVEEMDSLRGEMGRTTSALEEMSKEVSWCSFIFFFLV
jgi:hypothetical protein